MTHLYHDVRNKLYEIPEKEQKEYFKIYSP